MDDQTVMAGSLKEAQLIVREGPEQGASFPLPKEAVTIGRDSEADITIKDPEISRRHARISWQAGSYVIEDLGSTNGTTLNGVKITGIQQLNPGDTIEIGQSILTLQLQAESAPVQTPSSTVQVAPPAPAVSPVSPPADEEKPKEGKSKCLLWGCGCLVLFALLVVVVVVVLAFSLSSIFTPEQLQDLQRILDANQIPIQLSLGNLVRLMV
jgi:hypothetical protein